MKKIYRSALQKCFRRELLQTGAQLRLTQSAMATRLAIDCRSYADLEHGRYCCSAVTLILYLAFYCKDPMQFLEEFKRKVEKETEEIA